MWNPYILVLVLLVCHCYFQWNHFLWMQIQSFHLVFTIKNYYRNILIIKKKEKLKHVLQKDKIQNLYSLTYNKPKKQQRNIIHTFCGELFNRNHFCYWFLVKVYLVWYLQSIYWMQTNSNICPIFLSVMLWDIGFWIQRACTISMEMLEKGISKKKFNRKIAYPLLYSMYSNVAPVRIFRIKKNIEFDDEYHEDEISM